VKVRSKSE